MGRKLKAFPIGRDSFSEIRENDSFYYVDKTLMIKEFIERDNKVALVTRPRRFGKTLNMTMVRDFFDVTVDSRKWFDGLAIMDTEYASQINQTPVIYFTLKNSCGNDLENFRFKLGFTIYEVYKKYYKIIGASIDHKVFHEIYEALQSNTFSMAQLEISIYVLMEVITNFYKKAPILIIDEYDQPIMSSHEHGYHDDLGSFFENFYGLMLKSNDYLSRALLTGIQRIAKESIFSKINNIAVYTVFDEGYAPYFGLAEKETANLLEYYGLELNEGVREYYDGYIFGGIRMYNPWSILFYADRKVLSEYWINTSTNKLIRTLLLEADQYFMDEFDELILNGSVNVLVKLETSYFELSDNATLWGLLINAGYITRIVDINRVFANVRIPNHEVRTEFIAIMERRTKIRQSDLAFMFSCLISGDVENFVKTYKRIVLTCTSYHDSKENAYHMLLLGMCISLQGIYKITSNIESGHGRSDIILESLSASRPHIVFEIKQGDDVESLKQEALDQIISNQYHAGLNGEVLLIGLAHDKKRCEAIYQLITS